ncbi:hypothetical protein [Arthrobacter sp. H5]|uniref:phosphoribosylanthranilate isomerase n=1 Tax=Arthrobacter sp. H5 TaxID=1267973 RepID=UPI0004AF33F2|nr:hypothetical protein [Arthrobacter sp. H5]
MTVEKFSSFHMENDGARPLFKVCGAMETADIDCMSASGAGAAGLWWEIPEGQRALLPTEVVRLAHHCHSQGTVDPWLVTFAHEPAPIRRVLEEAGITWLQLHAFQAPRMVDLLRTSVSAETVIVKVLHISDGKCLEGPLLGAYERAGTDMFLLDAMSSSGQVGSTGNSLDPIDVLAVVERLEHPFLLAGGLNANNFEDFSLIAAHPRFMGIDVDTAARDQSGSLDGRRIASVGSAWGLVPERTYL